MIRPARMLARRAAAARGLASAATAADTRVGLVGLGKMGSQFAINLVCAGYDVTAYDASAGAVAVAVANGAAGAASPAEVAAASPVVITMLPNDAVLRAVVDGGLLAAMQPGGLHVSCSTIAPGTARELAAEHGAQGSAYVGAPIFARPDGVTARQGSFAVGGAAAAVARARPLLETSATGVFEFGEDPGAGNVVKLCGNFLIAAAIESISESLTLAEKNGVDRVKVMEMMSSTIFDCLIYKSYGERVSKRLHDPKPTNFGLELGLKDVTLVLDTAHKSGVPMPVGSVLHDRYLQSLARGRGELDWSAIGLSVAEDAGLEPVSEG